MNFLSPRHLGVFVALLVLFVSRMPAIAEQVSQSDGTLIVDVTWGDIGNTPANDVYVEAYGFVPKYRSEKSFVLKMSHDGEFKASLPPGVYDVFVSEGTSAPRCRRLRVREGVTIYWTLKLEIDDVYTNKSTDRPSK